MMIMKNQNLIHLAGGSICMRNLTNIGMVYNGWRSALLLGKPHILFLLLLGKKFSQATATSSALRGTPHHS